MAANVAGINAARIRGLVKTVDQTANALPNAIQTGGMKTAIAIKSRWYGIAAAAGIPRDGLIARRKWRISDSTYGKRKESMTLIVSYDGAMQVVLGSTKQHIIGAKLLGTRNSIRKKARRIGANAAFGGSNRGTFGSIQRYVNYNRYGSTRQQAMKGELRLRAGAQALTIPTGSGNLRAYAFHPGTAGKRQVWPESKAAAQQIGSQMFNTEVNKALVANFGKGLAGAASAATGGTL